MEVLIPQYRPEDYTARQALAAICERTANSKVGLGKEEQLVGFLDGDQVMAPDDTGEVNLVVLPEGYILCKGVHPDYGRRSGKVVLF